jgi:hypothetical protein
MVYARRCLRVCLPQYLRWCARNKGLSGHLQFEHFAALRLPVTP